LYSTSNLTGLKYISLFNNEFDDISLEVSKLNHIESIKIDWGEDI
jgi:hypothetical protein